jgi:predicted small metal-binding protein
VERPSPYRLSQDDTQPVAPEEPPLSNADHPPTTDETPVRCDCGYPCRGESLAERVQDGQRHAREAHGIEVSADQIRNQIAS